MADMYLGNESGGFDLVGTTNIKNIDFEEAKISKEDYENLSEEERKTGIHLVTGLEGTDDDGRSADLISYNNTNSGLDSTNVQGAIDELNSNLTRTTMAEAISLVSYNSEDNKFTFPSDGYLILSSNVSKNGGFKLYGGNGNKSDIRIAVTCFGTSQFGGQQVIFVKKGMMGFLSSSSSQSNAEFKPLE